MAGSFLEIDRGRLLRNLHVFRKLLGKDRRLMAVVKANAYGHGARLVARIVRHGADWYGVDSLTEAREIHALALGKPILILGHAEPSDAEEIVRSGFRPVLFRRDVARALASAARKLSTTARVHLKVETGLHRLGVPLPEIAEWSAWLSSLRGVVLEGVYTHFANVEDTSSTFFREQLEGLRRAVALLKASGHRPGLVHASPSAGVLLHSQDELALGRVGIGLYGIWPSADTRRASPRLTLEPVLSWKTRIAQVKTVPRGATVGYDLTYRAASERRIGVIPVGYYHGYDRKLSNRGWVLVGGRRAAVVGRVAMNMTMIDVSDAGANEGDEVVLLGEQGDDAVRADDLAAWSDTIAYEVVARLNPLLPRRVVDAAGELGDEVDVGGRPG